jgi:hypothetical protein
MTVTTRDPLIPPLVAQAIELAQRSDFSAHGVRAMAGSIGQIWQLAKPIWAVISPAD